MQVDVEKYKNALLARHAERERELLDQLAQRDALIEDLVGRLQSFQQNGQESPEGQQNSPVEHE